MSELDNPTESVFLDFGAFAARRERDFAQRVVGGVPDYAFSLDWTIRRKLDRVAPLRMLAEAMAARTVPMQRALYEARGLAVGPKQLPRVHQMGLRCAEVLGIGVPQIFVVQDARLNGWTYATDDVDQVIVLTSALVEALDDAELMTVIGHECGHIHNRHVIYNTLWELITNVVARSLLGGVLGPLGWLFQKVMTGALSGVFARWHRCAEFTCDRAGLICAGDPAASRRLPGKLAMGHVGRMDGFNAEAYGEQIRTFDSSALRVIEFAMSHPLGPKRQQAITAFEKCDVLHGWRPELKTDEVRSKAVIDKEIEAIFF